MENKNPLLSCIVTAFNEGGLAKVSIESILSQSFQDFELLIVDDGASEETRACLYSIADPRIRHIRQANDGLSSARNKAIAAATGKYVCFLDADDTRPSWAFSAIAAQLEKGDVDCVFLPGLLSEVRNEVLPFYDQDIFDLLFREGRGSSSIASASYAESLRKLALLEPQSANKVVRRELLNKFHIRFPSGLFFEDMLFHQHVLACMESYALLRVPCFTYYRRYGRPQITSSTSVVRFDAVSSAANVLNMFAGSRWFGDLPMRASVLASTFKLVMWCGEVISHRDKWTFRQAEQALISSLDPLYVVAIRDRKTRELLGQVGWVDDVLRYLEKLL